MNLFDYKYRTIIGYIFLLLVFPSLLSLVSLSKVPREFNPWPLAMWSVLWAIAYIYNTLGKFSKKVIWGAALGAVYSLASIVGFIFDFLLFSDESGFTVIKSMVCSYHFYVSMALWGILSVNIIFVWKLYSNKEVTKKD